MDSPARLKEFAHDVIDWNLAPADAVTLYLEWGNNNWHAEHAPVRSKADFATYFVVDTWPSKPVIRLVRRNSEAANDLLTIEFPDELDAEFKEEYGTLKGVFPPSEPVKEWIKKEMYA